MALDDLFPPDGVLLVLLLPAGNGVFPLGGAHLLKAGAVHRRAGLIFPGGNGIAGAPDVPQIFHRLPGVQTAGNLHHLLLPHAENQQIRLGVQQNGGPDFILPVIVVGEAPQGGFQPADNQGQIRIQSPDDAAVDNHRPIRAQASLFPRGVGVLAPALSGGGVVGHHGVDVAGVHQKAQPGPAKPLEIPVVLPVRLGQNGHLEPGVFQHPGDNGGAEGVVVHIGVPGDQDKIRLLPAPGPHILHGNR